MPVDNKYGSFSIARPGAGLGYTGPDADYSGAWTSHGICVRTATFTDTTEEDYWARADNLNFSTGNYWGAPYADDREPFGLFRVPTGNYQITEYVGQSEVNPIDPGYMPHAWEQWRDAGMVIVAAGQIVSFPDAVWGYNSQGWTLGRPPCWGTVTHSQSGVTTQTPQIASGTITATLYGWEKYDFTITFPPTGGPVTGSGFFQDLDPRVIPSNATYTLTGTFAGGDGGAASGTCMYIYNYFHPWAPIHYEANGTWTGNFYANGRGSIDCQIAWDVDHPEWVGHLYFSLEYSPEEFQVP
jgi:hypothetical protein